MAKTSVKSNSHQSDGKAIRLSLLDQIMPRFYIRLVLCFPVQAASENDRNSIYTTLEKGLQRTVTRVPFLGGFLEEDQDGSHNLHITSGPGVLLRSNDLTEDSDRSFNVLKAAHFSPSHLDGDILAPTGAMSLEATKPVMATQVNFLKGGLLLMVCIHHSVMDVAGLGSVLRTWAKNTKLSCAGTFGSDISPDFTAEALDRSPLMRNPVSK